jgi:ectoine hydroxylase-related dioxygenase (phytanoyl-CoA dioxygenase family)
MTLQNTKFVLTPQMVEEFYREGFVMAPNFISMETVDALNKEYEGTLKSVNAKEWSANIFSSFANQSSELPETAKFLADPDSVEVFEAILGAETLLWLGMYAVVPPRGKGLEWHQDNMYTHILGHMMNVFVALDDISEENAGLWLAPRSHLIGTQPNLVEDLDKHRRAAEPANGIPCKAMAPGDAVFFHRETMHHSKTNNTDKFRRAFAFQIASKNCRYSENGKLLEDKEPLRKQ